MGGTFYHLKKWLLNKVSRGFDFNSYIKQLVFIKPTYTALNIMKPDGKVFNPYHPSDWSWEL